MGTIYREQKVYFDNGHVYVHLDYADDEGYGVTLTGEQGIDGDLVGMHSFSFGHGSEAETLANSFFNVLVSVLNENGKKLYEQGEYVIPRFIDDLLCIYDPDDPDHLRDLDLVRDLVTTFREKENSSQ